MAHIQALLFKLLFTILFCTTKRNGYEISQINLHEVLFCLCGRTSWNRNTAMLCCAVMSNSLRPHGLQPAKDLCPWGFSRQVYWSGLPCPPSGALPNPGIEPISHVSTALAEFFTTELPEKPQILTAPKFKVMWYPVSRQCNSKLVWTEEPGRLQSMGSQRVGHNWATSLSLSKRKAKNININSN